MLSLFQNVLVMNKRKPARTKPLDGRWRNRTRLRVEELENRLVPAGNFTVDILGDTPDANPGDGVAKDANNKTSLRAAIMEINALPGAGGGIGFSMALSGGTITLNSALDPLNKDFTIVGLGPRT